MCDGSLAIDGVAREVEDTSGSLYWAPSSNNSSLNLQHEPGPILTAQDSAEGFNTDTPLPSSYLESINQLTEWSYYKHRPGFTELKSLGGICFPWITHILMRIRSLDPSLSYV